MDVDDRSASIGIELRHNDPVEREHYFQLLSGTATLLHQAVGETWQWTPDIVDEDGATLSRVSKEITNVNVFETADWPAIISFFKPRLIALDRYWNEVSDIFE